jgi:hypothetical protein
MPRNQTSRPTVVMGPLGELLTLETLPPPDTSRWVARRKAEVVAVHGGLQSIDEACDRYQLDLEELTGWQRAVERAGMPALMVTQSRRCRDLWERRQRF